MVVCDAVLRKLPGALGHEESALEESFSDGARRRPGVSALHAPVRVARARGAGGPAVGRPRPDPRVAARAEPPARGRDGRAGAPPAARSGAFATIDRLRVGPGGARANCVPPAGRALLLNDRSHRQPRARPAAPRAHVPGRRPGEGALPGRRGHPPPHPGLRRRRHQAPGQRRARDLHGPQAVVRRRRGAHVPAALAEDRADRGGQPRRRPPGEALLPARPRRSRRSRPRAPQGPEPPT